MSDVVIRVENLSKYYRLGLIGGRTLREDMQRWWASLRGKPDPLLPVGMEDHGNREGGEIWALRDVDFEVKRGEILGIIGANGAGKSTLLKILSSITAPTAGNAKIKGRVGSLLEVGTGFHPELTGRENIFLNGAILGMTKVEVARKFEEIVAFAEMQKFVDTPVKRYSSGMIVRLGFAVAAHLDPEILIVDEVLAVGDAAFQKRCLEKMDSVADEGRTVLFVSHNMEAMTKLTKQCLLLENGRDVFYAPTAETVNEYLQRNIKSALSYVDEPVGSEPKVVGVRLQTSHPGNIQANGQPMEVHIQIFAPQAISGARVSFQAVNSTGHAVLHLWSYDHDRPMCRNSGIYEVVCLIPKLRLYMGRYTLTVHLAEREGGRKFQTLSLICPFEVLMLGSYGSHKWYPGTCTYLEDCNWTIASQPRKNAADVVASSNRRAV